MALQKEENFLSELLSTLSFWNSKTLETHSAANLPLSLILKKENEAFFYQKKTYYNQIKPNYKVTQIWCLKTSKLQLDSSVKMDIIIGQKCKETLSSSNLSGLISSNFDNGWKKLNELIYSKHTLRVIITGSIEFGEVHLLLSITI